MESKRKVYELRERRPSNNKSKPTPVKRLDSAIRIELVPEGDSNDRLRKRERENPADGDYNIDDLRKLRINELRKLASFSGVSSHGSKKELFERLSNDGDYNGGSLKTRVVDDFKKLRINELPKQTAIRGVSSSGSKKELSENIVEEEDLVGNLVDAGSCIPRQPGSGLGQGILSENEEGEDTKKGSVVLDEYIPDEVKSQYHVLQQGYEIYHATLNLTDVGGNNNKFYIIQALKSNDGSTFMVYNRWGRVGFKGQDKLHGPYTSLQSALDEFRKKFLEKTNNCWCERILRFVPQPGYYTWLEIEFGAWEETVGNLSRNLEIEFRETKLEKRIARFLSLISNARMMEDQMIAIGCNVEKLPLRKLTKATILKGYKVLKRIAYVIGEKDREKLEQLSREFFTIIPHNFGCKKMSEFVIDSPKKLKLKLEMVESLGEIEVAIKLLEDYTEMEEDPLLSSYEGLHCELTPVEVDSKEFHMINKYMKNTHAETHSNYTCEIVQIFGASKHGEADNFSKFANVENRMLLWHGSRLTNWVGILSHGLRIAPPEAPVTGYMFGKGVYFADMFSKSANYCHASKQAPDGVLLLCEVALGEMAELLTANYHADKLPPGKLSTKGVGASGPDMLENETLEDGVVVPLGHPIKQLPMSKQLSTKGVGATGPDTSKIETLEDGVVVPLGHPIKQLPPKVSLLYNEYIAYNVNQIRMRYVVHVKFNFKKHV